MYNNYNNIKDYNILFNQLIERLTKKKSENIPNVEKAFKLAEKQHQGQFRQSGDPYILHPVVVASILEKLDFDTDVISGALLHDTVEDTNYSVQQIKTEFNNQIAEIVDGVTAINKMDYKQELDAIFDNADFLKPSLEHKTYQKLLRIGRKNRLTFYIKFADRLHNLQTIQFVPEYRKLEKVKETEKWILPICQLLKSSYFYFSIKNECFKITNEKKIEQFLEEYNRLITSLQQKNAALKENLFNYTANYIGRNKIQANLYKVVINPLLEEQIYQNITEKLQFKGLHNIRALHFLKVPTHEIFIILKNDISSAKANDLLFNLLEDKKINSLLQIYDFYYDPLFNINYFIATDKNKNKYKINLLSYASYLTYLNGSLEKTEIDLIDQETTSEIETNFIKVKTRSNEIIVIPSGSTLLDFAFKIHNDLGFSFKYGLINDSPSKLPQYTKLKEGDKITIVTEKDSATGQNKYIAQIRWLAYVKTETAKKALIRYFEKKYDA